MALVNLRLDDALFWRLSPRAFNALCERARPRPPATVPPKAESGPPPPETIRRLSQLVGGRRTTKAEREAMGKAS